MGSEKATPFNYQLGTRDNSAKARIAIPKTIPQFLPHFYLDTPMGNYELNRVNGGLGVSIYGLGAFDPLSKFANHAAIFATGALGAGGQAIIKRLPYNDPVNPTDDGKATMTVYLTVTANTIEDIEYDRDDNGKVRRDVNGELKLAPAGDIRNTMHTFLSVKTGESIIGLNPITTVGGININGNDVDTTSYPIFSFKSVGHGSEYNNFGISLTALTGNDVDTELLKEGKIGNVLSLYKLIGGKKQIIKTDVAGLTTKFSTAEDSKDPVFNKANTLNEVFKESYGFKPNPTGKETLYHFEDVVVYQDNIDLVAKAIAKSEIDNLLTTSVITAWGDFKATDSVDDTFNLSNLFTRKNSSGMLYETVRYNEDDTIDATLKSVIGDKISASLETVAYMGGGKDNDTKHVTYNTTYESAVYAEILKYSNPDSLESDLAINNVSVFIDSGFTFDMKKKLGVFLGFRKDVFLLASTFTVGVDQDLGEAISTGNLIKSLFKLYPESTLFGTATSRSSVVMGSCKLASGVYPHRVPLTYDLMIKLVRLAGASDGAWKSEYKFSRQPGNIVSEVVDILPKHIPNSIKNKLWDSGLIWVQNEDRDTYFYPATQTIYDNSTSVLNILLVNIALCYIVKAEEAVWREFTGADDLTNNRLKILAEESMNNRLVGRFADQYIVIPTIYYDKIDKNRGYSWKLRVDIGANNMKTVQESYIVAHRYEELGA